ncbi:MAG: phosphoribosylformylglycinamidine synthase I, partial [Chloroflexi bacterium]|nr:phosphoribosylformylglycinamidine synthase I [Chloroflexota bacterium]
MPHPERCCEEVLGGTDGRAIFASALRWAELRAGAGQIQR